MSMRKLSQNDPHLSLRGNQNNSSFQNIEYPPLQEQQPVLSPLASKIRTFFYLSFPIGLFVVTSSEFSIILLYQFNFLSTQGDLVGISLIIGMGSFLYFIIINIWLLYSTHKIF
jgi:hypothetical protein